MSSTPNRQESERCPVCGGCGYLDGGTPCYSCEEAEITDYATFDRHVLVASYEQKVEDLARETLRVSAALNACSKRGFRAPPHIVGEALAGWDVAMKYVEEAIHNV